MRIRSSSFSQTSFHSSPDLSSRGRTSSHRGCQSTHTWQLEGGKRAESSGGRIFRSLLKRSCSSHVMLCQMDHHRTVGDYSASSVLLARMLSQCSFPVLLLLTLSCALCFCFFLFRSPLSSLLSLLSSLSSALFLQTAVTLSPGYKVCCVPLLMIFTMSAMKFIMD